MIDDAVIQNAAAYERLALGLTSSDFKITVLFIADKNVEIDENHWQSVKSAYELFGIHLIR